MVLSKAESEEEIISSELTPAKKRRIRRKKLRAARSITNKETTYNTKLIVTEKNNTECNPSNTDNNSSLSPLKNSKVVRKLELEISETKCQEICSVIDNKSNDKLEIKEINEMSTKEISKSREEVIALREAKKLAKQKPKSKAENVIPSVKNEVGSQKVQNEVKINSSPIKDTAHKDQAATFIQNNNVNSLSKQNALKNKSQNVMQRTPEKTDKHNLPKKEAGQSVSSPRPVDEVDRACITIDNVNPEIIDKTKEQIKAERAAKKAAKQAKKKTPTEGDLVPKKDMLVKEVMETLNNIVDVAKEVQEVTAKIDSIDLETKKPEATKSKAELRAERRAKQEAQRAAKQATLQEPAKPKPETVAKPSDSSAKLKEEKSPKSKAVTSKAKIQSAHRSNWFQHLYTKHDKDALQKIPINSQLHPAIIRLGVRLASRVVVGSNARCIALLDALKKMVRDYTLPAKTEFARGLEAHLTASLEFLWKMRSPSASQTNAVKHFRRHLNQLPNNVDEFDAKKKLQEEIDRYIREQIDMAGEAISLAVRKKISDGDNILTFGCSSLIERILCEAWDSGVRFRAVLSGERVRGAGREMLRRLCARGVPCSYVDVSGVGGVMHMINKVVLGACALLVNGSVVGALGTAQVALEARAANVPVLVACETHKFSDRVHIDGFLYNEIGEPDDLIKSDENSLLKEWRSNSNLTPLSLQYDVTPPSLVTAVVTELAVLPCTSVPVVLRFKLSEYGI